MQPTVIEGGRVLDPAHARDELADLGIDAEGRIADPATLPPDALRVDARGLLVLPGFVDLHVHFREPGFEHKETIATGSRAAVAGGFTTVCCMPNTRPALDGVERLRAHDEAARAAGAARVHVVAAVTRDRRGRELADLEALAEAGAVAFSDDGDAIDDPAVMEAALRRCRALDRVVAVHEELPELVRGGAMHEGSVSAELGIRGRPAAAEEQLLARDLELARRTGGRLHVCHISTAGAVELVRRARADGIPVTAEVTPHHLLLQHEALRTRDPRLKCNPPLRTEGDRLACVAGLADGSIDCVATDHAPHSAREKDVAFELAAPGMIGLETALGLLLRLYRDGALSLARVVAALSHDAARCYGLDAGTLAPGAPADVTLVDLAAEVTVDPEAMHSRSRNTPFGGWRLPGRIVRTLVGGRTVHEG